VSCVGILFDGTGCRMVGESRGVDIDSGKVSDKYQKIARLPGFIIAWTGLGSNFCQQAAIYAHDQFPNDGDALLKQWAAHVETYIRLNSSAERLEELYAKLNPGEHLFAACLAKHDQIWNGRAIARGQFEIKTYRLDGPEGRMFSMLCNDEIKNAYFQKFGKLFDPRRLVDFACEHYPEICGGDISELTI
jgi:hypothetical protein